MKDLVFATNNRNKLTEVQQLLTGKFNILSLEDIKCNEELPETCYTLEGNALQKAQYVFEKYGYECFADDTGLEIEALNNKPGVYSARYAGEQRNANDNMNKVLAEMKGKTNRNACFKTVIAVVGLRHPDSYRDQTDIFVGSVNGIILTEKHGTRGFGYDPIFQPNGYDISFAEMSIEDKNKISHRALAINKMIDFLIKE